MALSAPHSPRKKETIALEQNTEKQPTAATAAAVKSRKAPKSPWQKGLDAVTRFIGDAFTPVIPVLIAGGLTGALLTLFTTLCGLDTESGIYQVFYALNRATFYFLPVFIGFSSAKALRCNPYLGALLGCVLLYVTVNADTFFGDGGLLFLGIPVKEVTYSSTVFPVLLGVLLMRGVSHLSEKVLPTMLKPLFGPLMTMLITVPVTLLFLGPLGSLIGDGIAGGVLAVYRAAPPLAVALVGAGACYLVFLGINNATYPIRLLLFAELGSDPLFFTGMAPANVAIGGACLAMAFLYPDPRKRSVAVGSGVSALCGLTEPAIYGVVFPEKYPLIGAMIGGGLGGFLCGLLGVTQYVVATPGFLSFAAYIAPDGTKRNFILMMSILVLSTVIAFLITLFIGRGKVRRQTKEELAPQDAPA